MTRPGFSSKDARALPQLTPVALSPAVPRCPVKLRRPASARTLATLAALAVTGAAVGACSDGAVDATTCASVGIGETRLDVDEKLGDPDSVTKAANGFAVARYRTTVSGVDRCCSVTFDSDSVTAIAAARPSYESACGK